MIRLEGLTTAATMAHAMDGGSFIVYVREASMPALGTGDVVIMEHLPVANSIRYVN